MLSFGFALFLMPGAFPVHFVALLLCLYVLFESGLSTGVSALWVGWGCVANFLVVYGIWHRRKQSVNADQVVDDDIFIDLNNDGDHHLTLLLPLPP